MTSFLMLSVCASVRADTYYSIKSVWSHEINEHKNKYDEDFNIKEKQLSISINFAGDNQWSGAGVWVVFMDEGYDTYDGLQQAFYDNLYDLSYPYGYDSGLPYNGGAARESEYFVGYTDEDEDYVSWDLEIDEQWFKAGQWYRLWIRVNGTADEWTSPGMDDNQWLNGKTNDYGVTWYVNSLGAVIEYTNNTEITNEYLDWIGDIVIAFMEEWGFQTFSGGVTATGIIFKLINRKENYYEM